MKKGRSNVYTSGVCDIVEKNRNIRFAFFEIDETTPDLVDTIDCVYEQFNLDVLKHRTGKGYHWLSPTEISADMRLTFRAVLSNINPECPMTTMRIEPNKHLAESTLWYLSDSAQYEENKPRNNIRMCTLLNHVWKASFSGERHGHIEIVRYPLPS